MRIRPGFGVVDGGAVLEGHDIHLVEVNLWNGGARMEVTCSVGMNVNDDVLLLDVRADSMAVWTDSISSTCIVLIATSILARRVDFHRGIR